MKNISKRLFIKSTLLSIFSVTGTMQIFANNLTAKENPSMIINDLIDVLRSTNNLVCENAAIKLMSESNNQSSYDLHLRDANLKVDDIEKIIESIKKVHDQGGPALHSFSLSYNLNLKDKGTLNLVSKLPSTLTEIGLVGCGISDKGGEALIALASKTPKLHWLCVEQNSFSNETKQKLMNLAKKRSGLLVVV